jgi:hypothetical protein
MHGLLSNEINMIVSYPRGRKILRAFTTRSQTDSRIVELQDKIKTEQDKLILTRRNFLDFEFGEILDKVVDEDMRVRDLDFGSYFLPLSFFLFMYLSGFLIIVPLINSVFSGTPDFTYIPLFDEDKYVIPLMVVQWGFLGGFVYTSIGLLNRFLRKDITPAVYFHSSFRLLMSTVVAVNIYFLYMAALSLSVLTIIISEMFNFIS